MSVKGTAFASWFCSVLSSELSVTQLAKGPLCDGSAWGLGIGQPGKGRVRENPTRAPLQLDTCAQHREILVNVAVGTAY